jgi:CRISPR type III-A-associated RAMP protein Csm4
MQPGLLIRLRPLGAWRFGPADGSHDRVDTLYRSDRLYSAVTLAMQRLDLLDQWLDATARTAKPAVVFSSLFPFQGDTLYAIPPATLWPPPPVLLNSPSPVFLTKIRWKTARFVPLTVIDSLVTGQPILADQWLPDPESGCLLRRDRPSSSPFRIVVRTTTAVDRLTHASDETKPLACVEFEANAGLWTVARFAGPAQEQAWSARLQAALRLLSDSGFGGGRSKGWGQTQTGEFQAGSWPALLLPKLGRLLRNSPAAASEEGRGLFWLLSLYSPATADKVDWSGGNYSLAARGGRVESTAGQGVVKKTVRMVSEGCVLASQEEPVGTAVDVAPDGFAHPVYRSGFALALRLPVVEVQPQEKMPVEESSTTEAVVEEFLPAEQAEQEVAAVEPFVDSQPIAEVVEHPAEIPAPEIIAEHAEPVEPPPAEPPIIEPPPAEPPDTEPPEIEPPGIEPPGIEPPNTEPPIIDPPNEPQVEEPSPESAATADPPSPPPAEAAKEEEPPHEI